MRWEVKFAVASWLLLALVLVAHAQPPQPPPQTSRLEFLEQRVRDLRDYRDFLEDQLAAAKAVVTRQDAALKACQTTPPTAPEK